MIATTTWRANASSNKSKHVTLDRPLAPGCAKFLSGAILPVTYGKSAHFRGDLGIRVRLDVAIGQNIIPILIGEIQGAAAKP